jgi:glycosyltransferase involved in cell wall biosynthesis
MQNSPAAGESEALARNEPGAQYLITVTNFKPHKNTSRVVEAFRIAKHELPGLRLAVIGNDPRALAGGLGSPAQLESEGIRVLGYVSETEMKSLFSSAAAFVFPSLYEGFGFPVLESMAAGTPVVTSAVASLPEVGGDAVLYADPNDAGDIARAVVRVCRDPELRSSLRARGLKQAAKFRWNDAAAQTLGVYEEAVHVARGVRR